MEIREQIISLLQNVLFELTGVEIEPQLSFPSDMQFGDYSTNVAMVVWGKLISEIRVQMSDKGINSPMDLAEKVAEEFRKKDGDTQRQRVKSRLVGRIEVAKPGFINFWVDDFILIKFLQELSDLKDEVIVNVARGRKAIVEYSSPNIAKPFTIGHLRSTIIGDAVANLLQATGWNVYRDNHVGDWGTQFGKQIYAIKNIPLRDYGESADVEKMNEEVLNTSENPVKDLVALYVKFHDAAENDPALEEEGRKWFKKLENGDEEARRLWKLCIDWSWREFSKIYEELGVRFTENEGKGYGESYFEDKMGVVTSALKRKHLLQKGEDGAELVFFPNDKYPPLMLRKKDGATLYATRDLATDRFRLDKYGNDIVIINEVGAEQSLYMNQIYLTEDLLGWVKPGQRIHIKHGLYRFQEGKMSTRKGNVIWLEDVIRLGVERAKDLSLDKDTNIKKEDDLSDSKKEIIQKIAIGALKWNDLKRDSIQDITFDWDDVLNMEGNSGPYLQYTYARTRSVLGKIPDFRFQIPNLNTERLDKEERDVLRCLVRFNGIVVEAAERYSPNVLCSYLFQLAQLFNLFYQKCPILKAEDTVRAFRLDLVIGVSTVLRRGLAILGIEVLERM